MIPGPPFRGILSPGRHVNNIDGKLGQFWTEGGTQFITTALNDDNKLQKGFCEIINRCKVAKLFAIFNDYLSENGYRAQKGTNNRCLYCEGSDTTQQPRGKQADQKRSPAGKMERKQKNTRKIPMPAGPKRITKAFSDRRIIYLLMWPTSSSGSIR